MSSLSQSHNNSVDNVGDSVRIAKPFASFVHSPTNSVYSIIELPDGTILTGSSDSTIKRWDPSRGYICIQTFSSHQGDVSCLVLLKNYDYNSYHNELENNSIDNININNSYFGDEFVSGSWDMSIKGWSLSSGLCTQSIAAHKNLVNCIVQLRHTRFVRGGRQYGICCDPVNSKEEEERRIGNSSNVSEQFTSSTKSDDLGYGSLILVSGSYDTTIKLWDWKNQKCIKTLKGHSGSVETVCEVNEMGFIATGSWDRTIRIWDLVTGTRIQDIVEEHTDFVRGIIRVGPESLVSCSNDNTVKFWKVSKSNNNNSDEGNFSFVCCVKTSKGHSNKIYSIAGPSWNHSVVTGSGDKSIVGWGERGEVVFRCEPTSDIVMSLVCLRDGSIACGLWNGKVEIWKISTLS